MILIFYFHFINFRRIIVEAFGDNSKFPLAHFFFFFFFILHLSFFISSFFFFQLLQEFLHLAFFSLSLPTCFVLDLEERNVTILSPIHLLVGVILKILYMCWCTRNLHSADKKSLIFNTWDPCNTWALVILEL